MITFIGQFEGLTSTIGFADRQVRRHHGFLSVDRPDSLDKSQRSSKSKTPALHLSVPSAVRMERFQASRETMSFRDRVNSEAHVSHSPNYRQLALSHVVNPSQID